MSEALDPASAEAQERLRDALLRLKAPMASPEEMASDLDAIIGMLIDIERQAHTPGNSLDGMLHRALVTHLSAGDAADLVQRLIYRLEEFQRGVQAIVKDAEAALREAMNATGTQEVETLTHVAVRRRPTRQVVITDESKLPIDVFSSPPMPKPRPSREMIKARFLRGEGCDGAEYADSEPAIAIKAKQGPAR